MNGAKRLDDFTEDYEKLHKTAKETGPAGHNTFAAIQVKVAHLRDKREQTLIEATNGLATQVGSMVTPAEQICVAISSGAKELSSVAGAATKMESALERTTEKLGKANETISEMNAVLSEGATKIEGIVSSMTALADRTEASVGSVSGTIGDFIKAVKDEAAATATTTNQMLKESQGLRWATWALALVTFLLAGVTTWMAVSTQRLADEANMHIKSESDAAQKERNEMFHRIESLELDNKSKNAEIAKLKEQKKVQVIRR